MDNIDGTFLSLNQGKQFQQKRNKNTKNSKNTKNTKNSKKLIEGFVDDSSDILNKQRIPVFLNQYNRKQENQAVTAADIQQLTQLQDEYENLANQLNAAQSKAKQENSAYFARTNSSNPYLGKVIQLTGGALFYVTNQGVAKQFDNMEIYTAVSGKNGFPPQGQYIQVSIPWSSTYNAPGATLPTNPPLITGTPIQIGQGVGDEGSNVYVNTMLNNPQSSYVGCYNNLPPSTEVMVVPKMNSTNSVNGYNSYASSVYQANNNFTGPWNAFDQNINTWWHTYTDSSNFLYNGNTGQYTGTQQTTVSGVGVVMGEWLQINFPGVNTSNSTNIPLTRYEIQGRQGCCGQPNGRDPNTWYIVGFNNGSWYQVDYQTNISFNWQMLSFNVSNPTPYGAYRIIITVAGDNNAPAGTRSCVQIATWNLYTSSNYTTNPTPSMTNVGSMSYDQCQNYAVNSQNQYFGLQSVDGNGNGNCMVSNDLAGSQIYGVGINYNSVPLWDSKTYGNNPGSTMSFNNGSLNVLNSSGASIFSTPNTTAQPSNYIGCYGDSSKRAMALYNKGSQQYNNLSCQQIAKSQGSAYYGLQNSTSGKNAQCTLSNNLGQAQQYGIAKNCTKISNGSWSGGGWSNAVYSTSTPTVNYYLYLQDDGNMCIYLGSGPSDYQGGVWCSQTNGRQQQPNSNFAAEKGKYGQNWISSGSVLAPGDFVGSTNGSIYLLMQSDGNLVLYTSTISSKCSSNGGKNIGSQNTTGLYQLNQVGIPANLGQLSYIDGDSNIHNYPSTNTTYANTYTTITGADSAGYDIPGAAYSNATVEQCQTSCNNNTECAGFAFSNNVCYPKNSTMYPVGQMETNPNVDLYTRDKIPLNPPVNLPNTINNIDTITYSNYNQGVGMTPNSEFFDDIVISNLTKANIDDLQSRMISKGQEVSAMIDQLYSKDQTIFDNMDVNNIKLENKISQYKRTAMGKNNTRTLNPEKLSSNTNNSDVNGNMKEGMQNLDMSDVNGMLVDTDLRVLQENYSYVMWSVLAVGLLTITINVMKANK